NSASRGHTLRDNSHPGGRTFLDNERTVGDNSAITSSLGASCRITLSVQEKPGSHSSMRRPRSWRLGSRPRGAPSPTSTRSRHQENVRFAGTAHITVFGPAQVTENP